MTKQKLPEFFYATIKVTMNTLMACKTFGEKEILDSAWNAVRQRALEQIKRIKKRERIINFYEVDVGYDFEFDYRYAWVDVDGIIQLLRMDMLPIGDRSLKAEISSFDNGMIVEWNDVWQEHEVKFR